MARSRNIKPGLFKNEVLGVADPLFTILFQGLWVLADREGRLEDRPMRVKAEILPYRESIDMDSMLDWLAGAGFIERYQTHGNRYIQIVNFGKHQNPHKNESASAIPAPMSFGVRSEGVGQSSDSIGTDPESIGSTRADSLNLIPDSLSSDSLTSESSDSGVSAAPASPPQSGEVSEPMTAKEHVWTLGPSLLGERSRTLLGKLVATYGESLVSAVLADCAKEQPGEPKPWVVAACASRHAGPKSVLGATNGSAAIPCPSWVVSAGFQNVFEAESAGCNERNHKSFQNGRKAAA